MPLRRSGALELMRKRWTTDELNVLTAIFMVGSFSIGDDERLECRIIADAIGRSPSAVDRQWRNIAALLKGDTELHIGQLVGDVLQTHLDDPLAGRRLALRIAERNGWKLQELIRAGEASEGISTASPADTTAVRQALLEQLAQLDYCVFPSGSHGFALSADMSLANTRRYRCYVSCTLLSPESVSAAATVKVARMSAELRATVSRARVLRLPSGGLSVADHSRLEIGRERFAVAIRVVQVERGATL
jgi:hypothetical protein